MVNRLVGFLGLYSNFNFITLFSLIICPLSQKNSASLDKKSILTCLMNADMKKACLYSGK
jgi:hypothetical protein